MAINRALINIFILLSLPLLAHSSDDYECVYTIYIRTGSIIKAGTDSKISLELWTANGDGVNITDIEDWGGLMGQNYEYFERGHLDIFGGRGPCLSGPICGLRLISDGSGAHAGWYVNYVEVTTTGPHKGCNQQQFQIEQWLALDAFPYELIATRNQCPVDFSHSLASNFIPIVKTSVVASS
uniref:Catalase n=1 Tax=Opuntia streptacantha TaxID=393608 RepID=A0A7C8ZRI3_OPUST